MEFTVTEKHRKYCKGSKIINGHSSTYLDYSDMSDFNTGEKILVQVVCMLNHHVCTFSIL